MFEKILSNLWNSILNGVNQNVNDIYSTIEYYVPKLLGALAILGLGIVLAIITYKAIIYIFNKFKIIKLIDDLFTNMRKHTIEIEDNDIENKTIKHKTANTTKTTTSYKKIQRFSDQIKIDEITAKSFSYYLILVFFRFSVEYIGILEVETFLKGLTDYLPRLFIAVIILFFGIRFANFIYDIVFHALNLTKQKTAKIVAIGAQIIILFFTIMASLPYIGVGEIITRTILIGFISMISIAGGLAFGLGGKDIAKEILESFKK